MVIRILSLGAGVQSSCLALMASTGEIDPPVAAVFADTQCEPRGVYEWLDRLECELSFPVIRATRGNLAADVINSQDPEVGRVGQPPFYVINRNGDGTYHGGVLWRKCTKDYKLDVIRREVAKLRKQHGADHVDQMIGISIDEAHRMKDSGVKYITNVYPLIDKMMSRDDCLRWLGERGYANVSKSACWMCPYTSNGRWRDMKRDDPNSFALACDFDDALRKAKLPGVKGDCYVWRGMRPLRDADFGVDPRQMSFEGFGNECEGLCGV